MERPIIHWCHEYLFVFMTLAVLKHVFFPFVLWWWFAPGDWTTTLHEATSLVFTVLSVLLLLALGSISRYRYGLTLSQVMTATVAINLPFFILSVMPYARSWGEWWWSVISDGIQLWVPFLSNRESIVLFPLSLCLISIGRRLYVRETETSPAPLPESTTLSKLQ